MDSNVRRLRSVPEAAEEEEEFSIDDFVEQTLGQTMYLIRDLEESSTREEFRAKAQAVQANVAAWPLG